MQDAIEANLFAFPLFHPWSRTVASYDGPDLLWTMTDVPHPLFNSVLRARLDSAEAAIDAAIARGMPVLWWVGPSSTPTDLGARLIARGFRLVAENPGMALSGPLSPRSEERRLAVVHDDTALRLWNSIPNGSEARYQFYAETAHLFRHYIAYADGEPAGTATLFEAAGVAGIYNVYVKPEHRRRGIGEALTRAALQDAESEVAVLQASTESAALYRRMGFVDYGTFGHYVWP